MYFCCLTPKCAANIIGLFQWVGVAAGLTLLILHLKGAIISTKNLELPIMLLVAYTIPAFTWFASIFSPLSCTKKAYGLFYFVFHILVESYALLAPIIWLHS